jgi:hypothetical protein
VIVSALATDARIEPAIASADNSLSRVSGLAGQLDCRHETQRAQMNTIFPKTL